MQFWAFRKCHFAIYSKKYSFMAGYKLKYSLLNAIYQWQYVTKICLKKHNCSTNLIKSFRVKLDLKFDENVCYIYPLLNQLLSPQSKRQFAHVGVKIESYECLFTSHQRSGGLSQGHDPSNIQKKICSLYNVTYLHSPFSSLCR